jgi:hypothetical protein
VIPDPKQQQAEALRAFRQQSGAALLGFQRQQPVALRTAQVGTQRAVNQQRQQVPSAVQEYRTRSVQAQRESRAAQVQYARQAPAARNAYRQESAQSLRRFQQQQPTALRSFQTASTQARTQAAQQRPALLQANRAALSQARQQQPAAIAEYRTRMSEAGANSRGLMASPKTASEARRSQALTTEMSRRATGGTLSRSPVGGTTNVGFNGRLRDGGTVRSWAPFQRTGGPRKTIGGISPTRRALGGASLINPNRERTDRRTRTDKSMAGRSATLADPDAARKGQRDAQKYGRNAEGKARSRGEWEEREKLKARARAILKKGPPTASETAELESIKGELAASDVSTETKPTTALADTTPRSAPVASETDRYREDAGFAVGAAAVSTRGNVNGIVEGSASELSNKLEGNATQGDEAQVKDIVGGKAQANVGAADASRQQRTADAYRQIPGPRGRTPAPRPSLTRFSTRTPRAAEAAMTRLESQPRYAAA